ncbi:DNA binding protein [Phytophthora megakarya]|uniref:DNA binding protein n=1 Tax=Phytophthora megakarya TaxID=4795 RepID=A0A225UYZ8_9STRA|nr:DNA binding protein [Phytophthora megakarya]
MRRSTRSSAESYVKVWGSCTIHQRIHSSAERSRRTPHGTIMERVRALLLDAKLPKPLWAECVCHVTTLINMTSSSKTDGRTPNELWYNRIPSMQYIKGFGCSGYVHITEQYRDKLDARVRLCKYLGVPDHKKGYRLMDTNTHVIVYSRDVVFKEDEFPALTALTSTPGPTQPTNRQ